MQSLVIVNAGWDREDICSLGYQSPMASGEEVAGCGEELAGGD